MLRIDETSKTLVAPQAGGLVTEASPDREELLALVGASWEAFAQELGLPHAPAGSPPSPCPASTCWPSTRRPAAPSCVQVTGETVEWQLDPRPARRRRGRRGWTPPLPPACHEALEAAVPGDSPQIVHGRRRVSTPSALETARRPNPPPRRRDLHLRRQRHALRQRAPAGGAPRAARGPGSGPRRGGPVDADRRSPRPVAAAPMVPAVPAGCRARRRPARSVASENSPQSPSVRPIRSQGRAPTLEEGARSFLGIIKTQRKTGVRRATCGSWSDAWS